MRHDATPAKLVATAALGCVLPLIPLPAAAQGIGTTLDEARAATSLAQAWLDGTIDSYGDFDITYDGPPITIRVTSHGAETASLIQLQMRGWEVLERMSEGHIVAETYWGGSVHGVAEGRDAVRSGLSDFAPCLTLYNANDYGLMLGMGLPFLFPHAYVSAAVGEQLYGEFMREEFEDWGVMLGYYGATSPYQLYNNGPVRTLADFQGLKARAAGMQGRIVQELGGVPVSIPSSDIYQAMQRGLIDAVPLSYSSGLTFRVNEVAEYITENGFFLVPWENCVSPRWIEALPDDLRTVFNAWARQMTIVEAAINFDVGDMVSRDAMVAEGATVLRLDADEIARWEARLQPMRDAWIAEQEARGRPAAAMMERLRTLSERYAAITPDQVLQEAIDAPVTNIIDR